MEDRALQRRILGVEPPICAFDTLHATVEVSARGNNVMRAKRWGKKITYINLGRI